MSYKILFLGAEGSGKSSILRRFAEDKYEEDGDFEGESHPLTVDAGGKKIQVQLFHQTTKEDLSDKGVVGVIFVFDVTSQESFDALAPMVEKMKEVLPNAPAVMCANKVEDDNADDRVVTFLGAKEIYSATIPVFETSAKTGKNIKVVLNNLGMLVGGDLAAVVASESAGGKEGGKEGGEAGGKGGKSCCLIL